MLACIFDMGVRLFKLDTNFVSACGNGRTETNGRNLLAHLLCLVHAPCVCALGGTLKNLVQNILKII